MWQARAWLLMMYWDVSLLVCAKATPQHSTGLLPSHTVRHSISTTTHVSNHIISFFLCIFHLRAHLLWQLEWLCWRCGHMVFTGMTISSDPTKWLRHWQSLPQKCSYIHSLSFISFHFGPSLNRFDPTERDLANGDGLNHNYQSFLDAMLDGEGDVLIVQKQATPTPEAEDFSTAGKTIYDCGMEHTACLYLPYTFCNSTVTTKNPHVSPIPLLSLHSVDAFYQCQCLPRFGTYANGCIDVPFDPLCGNQPPIVVIQWFLFLHIY